MSEHQATDTPGLSHAIDGLPTHVQWLVNHRGDALMACAGYQMGLEPGVQADPRDLVVVLAMADPSPHKHATQWLCDTLLAGGLYWEDLAGGLDSKTAETLGLFAQHRAGLPRGSRNLEGYDSLGGVWQAISGFVRHEHDQEDTTASGRALRRIERAQARAESIIIHEGPELRLVVPTTQFAAQWWGRGTRWCTAATGQNAFDQYNRSAPLVIAVLPTTRYQMWLDPDGSMQFMDEADAPVRAANFEHQAVLQPLLEWACARGASEALALLPPAARTPELCRIAVQNNGCTLGEVPHELRTAELCKLALANNSKALEHVPARHMDAGMVLGAINALSRSKSMIDCVPRHLLTREFYMAAVVSNPNYFSYVPSELVDAEFCQSAVDGNHRCINTMPEHMVSEAMHRAIVEVHPQYVSGGRIKPEDLRTEMTIRAVQLDPTVLRTLSTYLDRDDVWVAALDAWPDNLLWAPKRYRTPERCRAAVKAKGECLGKVPSNLIDQDMCWDAVRSNPLSLFHVPEEYKTAELCAYAISEEFKEDYRKISYRQQRGLLQYVPNQHKTAEMCMLAVGLSGYSLRGVPLHMITHELCLVAVKSKMVMFYEVPKHMVDANILDVVAQVSPHMAYNLAPEHLKHLYTPPKREPQWTPDCLDDLVARVAAWRTEREQATEGSLDDLDPAQPG